MGNSTVVMYGASPYPYPTTPGDDTVPVSPRTQPIVPLVVYPEEVARQIRELREMVVALGGDKSRNTTPAEMVRRVVRALVEADPAMLNVIADLVVELHTRDSTL